jgi:hypothetical protein
MHQLLAAGWDFVNKSDDLEKRRAAAAAFIVGAVAALNCVRRGAEVAVLRRELAILATEHFRDQGEGVQS